MPHISVEYTIMVPILLMQVIFVPMAVGWMMDAWVNRRRETALQDVASHMGTTIQQLYLSLNRAEIAPGTTTQTSNVPALVESFPYRATASHRKVENSTLIDLSLALTGASVAATTRVILGPNVLWQPSTFLSNSASAKIEVTKFSNGTLSFSFG